MEFRATLEILRLFPNINATVKSLYSLPALPLTVGLSVFNRYMNKRARRMTFGVTCVVDMIVAPTSRPPVGIASRANRWIGDEFGVQSSAFRSVSVVSNQKRQVNWHLVSKLVMARCADALPVPPAPQCCLHCCSPMQGSACSGGWRPSSAQHPHVSFPPLHLCPLNSVMTHHSAAGKVEQHCLAISWLLLPAMDSCMGMPGSSLTSGGGMKLSKGRHCPAATRCCCRCYCSVAAGKCSYRLRAELATPPMEVEGAGKFEGYCCQRWRSAAGALVTVVVPVRQLASGGEEEEVL